MDIFLTGFLASVGVAVIATGALTIIGCMLGVCELDVRLTLVNPDHDD